MSSFTRPMNGTFVYNGLVFDRGLHFDWGERRSPNDSQLSGSKWLFDQINNYKKQ